ncbi:hypothetical protein PILCRDRAFT_5110 [Piloderma croceum F 1598]|uniref:Uncharacterized protein n=1 Tax=Piloderma croceum (strain F 1598) TaxID=765440 RepID=A0A0C3C8K4_PILCF|nr:hypothetical protein PILCRDRAFT_5110 [Piloderma croceum F 1598]
MSLNKTPMAAVEQSSPSKVPILSAGDISPAVMRQFEDSCRNYFIHKKIIADDQVSLIIGGILDSHVSDWISTKRNHLIALSFDTFMIDFCTNYLTEDWEEDTLCDLLSMTQGNTTSFWDFVVAVQNKNSLLCGTTSHLPDDKLRHQINAGMEVRLSKKVSSKKLNKVVDFRKWLNEVRSCDEGLRVEREEYERIARDNCESFRCVNHSNNPHSRRISYTNNLPTTGAPAVSSEPRKQCPKLLDSKHKLLNNNEGCVECCNFFENHRAANCPNNFLNPATYKTLMQVDVDRAWRTCGKCVAAVTAISPADTSSSSDGTSHHPVTAVLGFSHNLVAYVAPNASSVFKRSLDGDSDSSGSQTVSDPSPQSVVKPLKEASPLHVEDLYWRCLTSGNTDEFPVIFDALIDHGLLAVLISEDHALKLGLCLKRLRKPYIAELAMEKNGQKTEFEFSEYIKLQLHDLSSYWSSKTICAIVMPGLCSPMILGLPFLSHNDIVVDASACTAIDKK